jgi:hypothetical protein
VEHRGDRAPVPLDVRDAADGVGRRHRDRAAARPHERALLLVPLDEVERRVAQHAPDRLLDPVQSVALADLDDEGADRGTREPSLEEAVERGERDGQEPADGHEREDVEQRVGEPLEEQREQEREDRRRRGEVDGEDRAPERRAGVAVAPDEERQGGGGDDGGEHLDESADGDGRRMRVHEQEAVVRAAAVGLADGRGRRHEERRDLADGDEEPGCDDDRLREPALEAPARVGEHEVEEQRVDDGAERDADREERRVVRRGEGAEEEREADERHQATGAVPRAHRPGDEAGGDEREPDDPAEHRGRDLRRLVVAREHEDHGERRRECGQQPDRDRLRERHLGDSNPVVPRPSRRCAGAHPSTSARAGPHSSAFAMNPAAPESSIFEP